MKKLAISAAVAALALAAAGSASATVVTLFVPTVGAPTAGYTLIDDFGAIGGSNGLTGSGYTLQSGPNTPFGAQPDEVPQPPEPYLDVMANGTANVSFAALTSSPVRRFEFDWGSVDTFNTLLIHVQGQADTMINPPAPGNGSWTSGNTNGTFEVWGTAGEVFTGITLMTSQNSFEIDNIATAPAPEPASWAMMILGFGAIGYVMRRRSQAFTAA
jgi:hypothetical protein